MKPEILTHTFVMIISTEFATARTVKYLNCSARTVSAYSDVVSNRGRGEEFKLTCGQQVEVVGDNGGDWTTIRLDNNREAFVATLFLSSKKEDSRPVNDLDEDYPLSIRVLQTEQVPYVVQIGGGQASTSCSINGTTNTNGMAIGSGNIAFGNATSYSSLTMNCNSYETPPTAWRHVLNAMLIVASNGNAYIVACDAAWLWSKCRGLVAGGTFRAKMTSKGIAVEYLRE